MDNSNNKNIFSLKLFWQTVMQLKVIGFISMAVMAFITGFPIIIEGLNIRRMISIDKAAAVSGAAVINESDLYTSIVSPVSSAGILMIVIFVITPILAFYAWSFLNKRNTSDFYHSLPYKRQALFISKFAAVTFWQAVAMLTAFMVSFISYHIFNSYFIVDYSTTLHIYAAEFICALLCSAAIALACSITGNIFSNICLSGLIIFLPRFIIMLVGMTVTDSVATAASESTVWILDNSYNMLTAQVLGLFEPVYSSMSVSKMLLSLVPDMYTLILAVIYAVLACVLFVKRKSETAGKPALSWKLQFAIRTAIGFVISEFGIMIYVMGKHNSYGGYYFQYIVITFVIAAVVVIIYEIISNKRIHRIINAIPSILVAYIIAAVFGVIVNAGIEKMIAYIPDVSKIEYIQMSAESKYVSSQENNYFDDIMSSIKITDENVIKLVADAIKDNSANIKELNSGYYNSGKNYYEYSKYNVYIKDGVFGRKRKVYIKQSDVEKLAREFENMQELNEAYKNLPAYDEAKLSYADTITQEYSKKLYETLINEINNIPFTQLYNCINYTSLRYAGNNPYIYIRFTRNGIPYAAQIILSDKLPDTLNAYYNAVNKTARESMSQTCDGLKKYLDNFEEAKLNKSDQNDGFILNIYYMPDDTYSYVYSNNISDTKLISEIREQLDNPFDKTFDYNKVILKISYNDNNYNNVEYYMQLSDYSSLEDLGY